MASYFAEKRPALIPTGVKKAPLTSPIKEVCYNFKGGNLPKWSKDIDVYFWLQLFNLATYMISNSKELASLLIGFLDSNSQVLVISKNRRQELNYPNLRNTLIIEFGNTKDLAQRKARFMSMSFKKN